MLISFFSGLLLIFLTGKYFSKKSLKPLSKMADDARKISARNLDLRLKEGSDEIGLLAKTFNAMLERLEKSFESQKQFVSYLAHEFRTPLSIIIGEIELSLSKERELSEYRTTLETILNDSKKIAQLSETFLDLAKASYDKSEVQFQAIRLDECLIEASHKLQKNYPQYKIEMELPEDMEEEQITVQGNTYLLSTAFRNLIENACKFSANHSCLVRISSENSRPKITFIDQGTGVDEKDLNKLFTPFFRGSNKDVAEGSGIGLYLVEKIITLHDASIHLSSELKKGTAVTLHF
jgi:signal transduction histidine kinase